MYRECPHKKRIAIREVARGKNPGYFETAAGGNWTAARDAGKAACLLVKVLRAKA
jgi:hypothetical protein